MYEAKKDSEDIKTNYLLNIPENLNGLFEQLPFALVVTDETGKPVSYNQIALEILGELPPDIKPSDWPKRFSLYMDDGKTYCPEANFPLSRALQGERVDTEEIFRVDGGSSEGRWLSMSAKPVTSSDGKVSGALVLFSDITSRKQGEISRMRKVFRAEALYAFSQQIPKLGNDPMRIMNALVEFAVENVGDACFASLLKQPGDRLQVIAFHHNKPEARALLQKLDLFADYDLEGAIERVIHTEEPLLVPTIDQDSLKKIAKPEQIPYIDEIGVESMLFVPITGRFGVMGILSLIRDRGGSPYTSEDQSYIMEVAYRTGLAMENNSLVYTLKLERSGRRIVEEALKQSEARFQSIFSSTALGIKLFDLDGFIMETNPAFQQISGYTTEELVGKPIGLFWHPLDSKRLQQLLGDLKNNDIQSFQLEHRLLSKDGSTVWVNATFTGVRKTEGDSHLEFIVAMVENITKRKRMEAEMAEVKSRLHSHIEMERLRLAQELHDGPLQDLYISIYKIEDWVKHTDTEIRGNLDALKQDLLNVIQELRNTAKDLRPPALASFGLEKAIRSHADEIKENHPELTIHLNLAQDKQFLPEDIRLILFRIYQHSMANVIRHAQAKDVFVKFTYDAEWAELEIRDNGIGFEVPSSWVELVRQGHFGLAGAVERVELLEGSFTVASAPAVGTTIRVAIPITHWTDQAVGGEGEKRA